MFDGFGVHDIEAAGLRLHARCGGSGPALLLPLWSAAARSVSGRALDCGHDIAEEAPEALLGEAFDFFKE